MSTKDNPSSKIIGISVGVETHKRMKHEAQLLGISLSEFIRSIFQVWVTAKQRHEANDDD